MPIKKSGKKALRQSKKKQTRNSAWKKQIRGLKKKIEALIKENKKEEAKKLLSSFYKTVDKAAKNDVIKKNTAARKKSKISKKIPASSEK